MIRVMFICNSGAGFSGFKEVSEGTTLESFFSANMESNENMSSYMMTANRENVDGNYVLQDGDRVVFTPSKIEGA